MATKVGYILKKFPRLSETFILNEMLALEEAGVEVEVFSLKPPDDELRHGALENLKAARRVIEPEAPRTIFRYLEETAKVDSPEARSILSHYYGRLDAGDPLRAKALAYCVALAPLVAQSGVTHLHAHFGTISTATAAEVALLTGLPFSFTLHAKDIYRRTVDHERLARWIDAAAFAVTVCEANSRWLEEKCPALRPGALRVLYNGVDLERWKPRANSERLPVFITIGRFVEKKGFDDYLRACAILRRRGRTFRAYLIGSGELRDSLLGLRASLELEELVQMPGAMAQEQLIDLVGSALLCVAPCVLGADGNRDALPTVLLEAMASGTPCLSTPVSGIPEIIDDGVTGWIVGPRSPGALANVMESVLDDPGEAERRGREARKKAEARFDIRRNVAELASWFAGDSPTESPREPAACAPEDGGS